jgi:hypothetical protein
MLPDNGPAVRQGGAHQSSDNTPEYRRLKALLLHFGVSQLCCTGIRRWLLELLYERVRA